MCAISLSLRLWQERRGRETHRHGNHCHWPAISISQDKMQVATSFSQERLKGILGSEQIAFCCYFFWNPKSIDFMQITPSLEMIRISFWRRLAYFLSRNIIWQHLCNNAKALSAEQWAVSRGNVPVQLNKWIHKATITLTGCYYPFKQQQCCNKGSN